MRTREILTTVLHTAKCRGLDPVRFLEKALNTLTKDNRADLYSLLLSGDIDSSVNKHAA
jgi:hypothetical protein